jgi:hypothetical protein
MKFIGNRVSHQNKNGVFSVVIAASVERYKEALLAAWLLAWTICGLYFIIQLFGPYDRNAKLYIFVLLVFWGYYEYRIARIFLWRKYGYESIRIKDDKLYLRNVIRGRGKTREFFIENIEAFAKLQIDNTWLKTMDSSFWIMGNDYIHFMYQGKLVSFGRQLDAGTATDLIHLLNRQLIDRKRALKQGKGGE